MKQKKLNNILYVFDVNPYEITQDTDAEVIKVQEESYKGFVEMNQSLAEKIVKYNYHVMCVNVPEWAPYVEQEDPQGSLTFGIYGSAAADAINQIQVQNADNVIIRSWHAGVDLEFPFQTDVEEGQHCVIECKEGTDIYQFDVTGAEYLPISWEDQETGNRWYATQPITDSISIGINAASPSTWTVTLDGSDIHQNVTVKMNDEPLPSMLNYYNVADGTVVDVYPTQNVADYSLISGAVWDTDHWTATVNGEDLTITIDYASSTTYTITLDAQNLSDQNIEVKLNDNQVALTGEYVCQDNDTLTFWPLANPSDYIASNMDGFDDTPGQEHWWKTVNSSETIGLTYLGTGVNFVASWGGEGSTPENVSQINIGNTSVTGNDLTDPDWTDTVRLYPGTSQVQYFVSTGLPTDMENFNVAFTYQVDGHEDSETHYAYKQTDPDTGEVFYSDAHDLSGTSVTNPGIWQYNNTPDSGLPWIAFTFPATDQHGNAYQDNTNMRIISVVSGS